MLFSALVAVVGSIAFDAGALAIVVSVFLVAALVAGVFLANTFAEFDSVFTELSSGFVAFSAINESFLGRRSFNEGGSWLAVVLP